MAGGSVIIDANELRQFAAQLRHFNSQLAVDAKRLSAQFRQLGETWRDPAYGRFAQEFEQTMRNLRRFQQVSDQVIPQLLRKADRAEQVHGG
jgi:uncharacterized protein YukE